MLKIRLKRMGRRHEPSYRIVVVDSRQSTKSGRYIEMLGSYNPQFDQKTLNTERAQYWLDQGAQTSKTVHNLLADEGVITSGKVNALPRKQVIEKEEAQEEAPAAAEAESSEGAEESGEESSNEEDASASAEEEEKKEEAAEEESGGEAKSSDDEGGEEQESAGSEESSEAAEEEKQ